MVPHFDEFDTYVDDDDDVGVVSQRPNAAQMRKKPKQKGPMHLYFTPDAERVVKDRKEGKLKQMAINESCKKELRERACGDHCLKKRSEASPRGAASPPRDLGSSRSLPLAAF